MMRGQVLANENCFLLEKVENQSKEIETQKKQLETQKNKVDTLVSQLNNMGQQLNDVYGMLKVFQTAFPDLYNAASTSVAASTCDKQVSGLLFIALFFFSFSPLFEDNMFFSSPLLAHHQSWIITHLSWITTQVYVFTLISLYLIDGI